MKIAMVCSEYPRALAGGQGVVVRHTAALLAAAGHGVRVVGVFAEPRERDWEGFDGHGALTAVVQGRFPGAWVLARRRQFATVRGWARDGDVEVVEVPLSRGWAAHWGALPIPVVVRVHGSTVIRRLAMGLRPPALARYLEAWCLRRADAVSAVSEAAADGVRRAFGYRGPIAVIPNPVAWQGPPWLGAGSQEVVFVGARTASKGFDTMLAAWPAVLVRHPEAVLHCYGRGDGAGGGGLPDRVRLHGFVDQERLHGAFRRAAVVALPSRYEAFGLAAAEAMACGCPTIVSEHGAGPELVSHGETGLVCCPTAPAPLAAAIASVLSDTALARRLGEAGRERIRTLCDPSAVTSRLLALYRQAAGQ